MATVQQIIDRAIDRSQLNDSAHINTTAATSFISTEQRKVFQMANRLDPEFFGKDAVTATRAAYTDSWDLATTPGDIGVVTAVRAKTLAGTVTGITAEGAVPGSGTTINLVNFRFPDFDASPRAYIRGMKIVPHSTELGAADANMVTVVRVYYGEMPAAVTALGTTLRLPDEWQSLLVLPLARYFAIRDKREEEVAGLAEEYAAALQTFREAVLGYGHGVRRPLAILPTIPLSGPAPAQR